MSGERDELAANAHLTPDERIARVEELSRAAWTALTGSSAEPTSRRDFVRLKSLSESRRSGPAPSLRRAELADIAAMHVVRCAVRENRLSRPDRIRHEDYRAMLERDGRGWVAEVDERIVGFAVADLRRSNVWALFVDPEHEKRGIGLALHDVMMAWFFAQAGVECVWLTTAPGTRAEGFYRRAGWRACGLDAQGEMRFEMERPAR